MSKALPVLCVVLLGGIAAAWWSFGARRPGVADILPATGPRVAIRAGDRPVIELRVEDPREAIGGASAATAEPSVPVPEVPYAVVDAADGRGIAGARIIRARDGVVLGV